MTSKINFYSFHAMQKTIVSEAIKCVGNTAYIFWEKNVKS